MFDRSAGTGAGPWPRRRSRCSRSSWPGRIYQEDERPHARGPALRGSLPRPARGLHGRLGAPGPAVQVQEEESRLLRQDLQVSASKSPVAHRDGRTPARAGRGLRRQLEAWGLTPAEQEVGLLLLKGSATRRSPACATRARPPSASRPGSDVPEGGAQRPRRAVRRSSSRTCWRSPSRGASVGPVRGGSRAQGRAGAIRSAIRQSSSNISTVAFRAVICSGLSFSRHAADDVGPDHVEPTQALERAHGSSMRRPR